MRVARAGDPVEQAVGAVGLEVTADLVELLAAIADDAAGLADVAELAGMKIPAKPPAYSGMVAPAIPT